MAAHVVPTTLDFGHRRSVLYALLWSAADRLYSVYSADALTPSLHVRSFARGITCTIMLYSWRAQGAALHVFDAHGDAVRSVTFSADSKYTYQADSAT